MKQVAKDKKSYLPLIVTRLKNIGIHKIILFGSLTSSAVHTDSDVDLIVVTNDDHLPDSYKEKSEVYLKVSSALTDIARKIPIDLIVYTMLIRLAHTAQRGALLRIDPDVNIQFV